MFAYDLPVDPPLSVRESERSVVMREIQSICADIAKYGAATGYQNIYDMLFETVLDNLPFKHEESYAEND